MITYVRMDWMGKMDCCMILGSGVFFLYWRCACIVDSVGLLWLVSVV